MAEYHTDAVARALNCLSDVDFTHSLSNQDRHNLSDFIADFFCSAPSDHADEEEEPGEYNYYQLLIDNEFHTN